MRELSFISQKDRLFGIFLSLGFGITLAFTLLPAIHYFYLFLAQSLSYPSPWTSKFTEMAFFTVISAVFFFSIPKSSRAPQPVIEPLRSLLPSFVLPIAIAFIFGIVLRNQFLVSSQNTLQDLFWFVVCIPWGEELLFRGWFWAVFKSLFKGHFFTLTNPLPAELVFSSLAFSLWHLQNYSQFSLSFLLFQLLYTFLTGLWLGYLRWKTGKITSSVLAHVLINLATSLMTLL